MANCHSHAFHRALQGADAAGAGDVLDVAGADVRRGGAARPGLLPGAGAGPRTRRWWPAGSPAWGSSTTCTTSPTGRRTTTPTPWGRRSSRRQRQAGLRITLLDTCYLSSGFGDPPHGVQRRFSDGTAERWAERVAGLQNAGAAIHSVRAVPDDQLRTVVEAEQRQAPPRPPLRADPGERRLRRGLRRHAHPAARRPRRARPTDQRRARHPPHRRRHRPPRHDAHLRLLLPDHRTRPRRRHRPEPSPPRRRQPAHPRLRQPRGHRPVRGDARGRARRAPRHAATRPLGSRRAAAAATTDGHASLGYDDAGAIAVGAAGRPGHPRHHDAAHGRDRPRRAHRRLRGDRRRRRPGHRRRQGRLPAGRRGRDRPRAGRRHRRAARHDLHRHHEHRRARHQRPARRPPTTSSASSRRPPSSWTATGSPGPDRPTTHRPPTSTSTRAGARSSRGSSTATPTSSSPATARRSSPPAWPGRRTPPAASARPSPPPARPPTSSSPAASPPWSPRCAARARPRSRSRAATA